MGHLQIIQRAYACRRRGLYVFRRRQDQSFTVARQYGEFLVGKNVPPFKPGNELTG